MSGGSVSSFVSAFRLAGKASGTRPVHVFHAEAERGREGLDPRLPLRAQLDVLPRAGVRVRARGLSLGDWQEAIRNIDVAIARLRDGGSRTLLARALSIKGTAMESAVGGGVHVGALLDGRVGQSFILLR